METINVAMISHKHGNNFYLSKTEEGLRNIIYNYVVEYWEFEQEIPADKEDAITLYFDLMPGEWLDSFYDCEVDE